MANAHNGLGVALVQQGQIDRAIEEWRKALELRPDFSDARDNIQRAQQLKGRPPADRPFVIQSALPFFPSAFCLPRQNSNRNPIWKTRGSSVAMTR